MAAISRAVIAALKDPTLAAAVADFASRLLETQARHEDQAWGIEADGDVEIIETDGEPVVETLSTLGAIAGIAYVAEKGADGVSLYRHTFDPPRPLLCVDDAGELRIIRGRSRYTVETHGIIG